MRTSALTPHISVAIGGQVRLYHTYITTAPAQLDAPSTVTLYESTATDLGGFAIDPDAIHRVRSHASARFVLIDTVELTWQRARYADAGHALGNQHWPAVVKGTKVYVPLTVDRKVMASVMKTHALPGVRYEFTPGSEVIPYLAPHESRRLFGGASDTPHSHHSDSHSHGHGHDHSHSHGHGH